MLRLHLIPTKRNTTFSTPIAAFKLWSTWLMTCPPFSNESPSFISAVAYNGPASKTRPNCALQSMPQLARTFPSTPSMFAVWRRLFLAVRPVAAAVVAGAVVADAAEVRCIQAVEY